MLNNPFRNFRARANSSTSSNHDVVDELQNDAAIPPMPPSDMPSSDARRSVESCEFPDAPPSYDEVVSDEGFQAPVLAPVAHHESYRTRKDRRRSGSRVLSMEYGLRSSKIYMRG